MASIERVFILKETKWRPSSVFSF